MGSQYIRPHLVHVLRCLAFAVVSDADRYRGFCSEIQWLSPMEISYSGKLRRIHISSQ
jgi:hypothetical protein